jgi:hypothetical protein
MNECARREDLEWHKKVKAGAAKKASANSADFSVSPLTRPIAFTPSAFVKLNLLIKGVYIVSTRKQLL